MDVINSIETKQIETGWQFMSACFVYDNFTKIYITLIAGGQNFV